jgi:hypothetical protein
MGKIIVSENVPLDGVVQDPTGDEGFKHGGWFRYVVSATFEEHHWTAGERSVPTARRTYDGGAAGRSCYIGSSWKISTAHFPSLSDRNGRPSVHAFAAARLSASTIE